MKKVFSIIVALAMVAALAVSVSAAAIDNLPANQEIAIAQVESAPKVDGILDAIYGDAIWNFTGADAWAVDALGGAEADYAWNLWPDGFEGTESADAAKATTFTGYAVWNANKIYMFVKIDMGSNPYYFNPACEWQGNGIQMAICPADAWVDENSQIEWGLTLADATTMAGTCYRTGAFDYTYEELSASSAVLYDGSSAATYEFAFDMGEFEVECAEGLKVLFCISVNVNIADDLSTDDFNGYQIGSGVYNGKGSFGDSTMFVLAGGAAATAEEPAAEEPAAEEPATEEPAAEEPAKPAEKPATKPSKTADVSAVMYVLATLSTIGGAIVLKRK